ncbi:MAG: DedA family protein [Nitrospirae bacterium]|nr:DedA family protein [Nitrospirota bacterium]MDA8340555.1 DedA family protein [Nitrospiraceae bacterium]
MSGISGLIEHFPYMGLFLLLILGGIGLPFPEDTTLILCGFLIATQVIKPIPALLVVYAGLLITDFSLYFVGKKYGRKIVTHKRFRKIVSPERLAALEDKFNKKGILVILIGRHLVGLRAQIFLAAGVMRMSALKFIMADAISAIFTMAIMVGAGYIGGNSLEIIKRDITRYEHIGILLVIILLTIYLFFRYFKSRRSKTSL